MSCELQFGKYFGTSAWYQVVASLEHMGHLLENVVITQGSGMVREPLPSTHSDHPRQVLSVLIVILSTGIFMNAAIGGSLETPSVALNYSGSSAMK